MGKRGVCLDISAERVVLLQQRLTRNHSRSIWCSITTQVSERGFVPSALPDSHCYGKGSSGAAGQQVSPRS